jgi:hypothetical protein
MGDGCLVLKLKMLWLCRWSPLSWYREIWKREGGERICCSGYMCGCYGADYASQWEWAWRTRKDHHGR